MTPPADLTVPPAITGLGPVWAGVIAFTVAILAATAVRVVTHRAAGRGDRDRHLVRQLGRFLSLVVFVIGAVFALGIAGVDVAPMLGALGVGGIAVAFAAQDILSNLLAGVMIQVRRPFRIGDQISTNGYDGTVRDVDLRATRLTTYDGLDVVIPNANVLQEAIVNNTRTPSRRSTLPVGVAYGSDLERVRAVVLRAVAGVADVSEDPAPQAWVEDFGDSSIDLAVMFWHPADMASTWRIRSEVAISIARAFDAAGIEIPFPQRVLHQG